MPLTNVASGLRALTANNPSALTGPGTTTYVLGRGDVAVVDPGPEDTTHLDALLDSLGDEKVGAILVTHAHLDHSPLSRALQARTGAPVYGFGPPEAGRSKAMEALAAQGDIGGGEGTDHAFIPDITLSDGETLGAETWQIRALWTPGHFSNHLSFSCDSGLLCGDLAMEWASTLISPPDGDLGAFRASCAKLLGLPNQTYYPTHGAPIENGHARLRALLAHRQTREDQILSVLEAGPATPAALVAAIYTDVPEHLWGAAQRNVLAHLIALCEEQRCKAQPKLTPTAQFELMR